MKKISFLLALIFAINFMFASCGNINPTVPGDENVKPDAPGWWKYKSKDNEGTEYTYYIYFDADGNVVKIGDGEKEFGEEDDFDKDGFSYAECLKGSKIPAAEFEKCATASLPKWTSPTLV